MLHTEFTLLFTCSLWVFNGIDIPTCYIQKKLIIAFFFWFDYQKSSERPVIGIISTDVNGTHNQKLFNNKINKVNEVKIVDVTKKNFFKVLWEMVSLVSFLTETCERTPDVFLERRLLKMLYGEVILLNLLWKKFFVRVSVCV